MAKINLEPDELDHILGITADPTAMGQNQPIIRQQLPKQNASIPSITGMNIGAPAAPPRSITEPPLGAANPTAPLERPTPAYDKFQALEQKGAPKLHGVKKVLDVLSQMTWPTQTLESSIPGSPGHYYNREIPEAKTAADEEMAQERTQNPPEVAAIRAQAEAAREAAAEAAKQPKVPKEGTPEQQAYDAEIAAGKSPQDAFRSVLAMQQGAKPTSDIGKLPAEIEAQIGPAPEAKSYPAGAKDPKYKADLTAWGKRAELLKNQEAGAAGASRFEPLLESKTTQLINPDTGIPETFQWDPATKSFTHPLGTPGGGAYPHQIEQANALLRMVNNNVFPMVDKMEKSGEMGVIKGRFSDWLNRDVGNAPPDVAQFHQLMNGVVSMMMGMYGFRRQQAVETLASQMGARMTPASMRASLEGIVQHAHSIVGDTGQGGQGAAGLPNGLPDVKTGNGGKPIPDGAEWQVKGKVVAVVKDGQWVAH